MNAYMHKAKTPLKIVYSILAIMGILFVLIFSDFEKRLSFIEKHGLLYDILEINYLMTTLFSILGFFLVAYYIFLIIRSKKITFIDILFYSILLVQLYIYLFVRAFDWAFD